MNQKQMGTHNICFRSGHKACTFNMACAGVRGGASAIKRIFHTGLCSCQYQGVFFRKTVSFSENSAYVLNERAQTKNIYALRNNLVKLNYTLSMALSRQLQSSLHGISALITIILVPIVQTFMKHRSKESLLINLNFEKKTSLDLLGEVTIFILSFLKAHQKIKKILMFQSHLIILSLSYSLYVTQTLYFHF